MGDNELKVIITGESGQLKGVLTDASGAVTAAIGQMSVSFSSLQSTVNNVMSSLSGSGAAIGAAFAAMAVGIEESIRRTVDAAEEYADGIRHLSETLGMSTESASQLNAGLKILGMSNETYIAIAMRLERQVKQHETAFNQLGVAVRDSAGAFLPVQQVLENVVTKMQEYKAGQDQLQFAMSMLGPRGAQAAFELLHLKDAMAMAKPIMDQLGLSMGEKGVQAAHQLEMQSNALGLIWDGLKVKIGQELMPAMGDLIRSLGEVLPPIIKGAVAAFEGLISVMTAIGGAAIIAAQAIMAPFRAASTLILGIMQALVLAAKGDFAGAWNAIRDSGQGAVNQMAESGRAMVTTATDTYNKIKAQWTENPMEGGTKPSGTKSFTPPVLGKPPSMMPKWEEELKEREVAEQKWFGLSTEEEKVFWEGKLALASKANGNYTEVLSKIQGTTIKGGREQTQAQLEGLKEQERNTKLSWDERIAAAEKAITIETALYGAESAQAKKAIQDRTKLYEEEAKQELTIQAKRVDDEIKLNNEAAKARQKTLQFQVEMHAITAQQELALELKSENDRYASEQALLEKLKAIWAQYPEQAEAALNKIQDSNQKHNEAIVANTQQAAKDVQKQWDSYFNDFSRVFSGVMSVMNSTTDTWQTKMLKALQSITMGFIKLIESIVEAIAKQMIYNALGWGNAGATGVAGKAVSALGLAPSKAADATGAAALTSAATALTTAATTMTTEFTEMCTQASALFTTAATSIATSETTAVTEDTAATAEDSATLDVAALGLDTSAAALQAAAAALMASAATGMIPFAEKGWDIPFAAKGWEIPSFGSGGIVGMLHPNEMVLPEELANNVRSMTGAGSRASGPVRGGTINIHANDSADVARYFKKNAGHIASALKGPVRNFQTSVIARRMAR